MALAFMLVHDSKLLFVGPVDLLVGVLVGLLGDIRTTSWTTSRITDVSLIVITAGLAIHLVS